jgi:hypothetical protein
MNEKSLIEPLKDSLPRRSFVTRAGLFGLSATAAAFLRGAPLRAQTLGVDNQSGDTAQEIFTAALIAEDLASTFLLQLSGRSCGYGSESCGTRWYGDACRADR